MEERCVGVKEGRKEGVRRRNERERKRSVCVKKRVQSYEKEKKYAMWKIIKYRN